METLAKHSEGLRRRDLTRMKRPKVCKRLAFFCSSLAPGRDGVGDYTRRLAGELIRQGHPSIAIALNDPHAPKTILEQQEIEGASVSVLRLPSNLPWSQRTIEIQNRLASFEPDWISLQFVPFGFHPKGLCLGVGKTLLAINTKASWHMMFHELWLGLGQNSSMKDRVWGGLQRSIVRDLIERLRPRIVQTQTEPYRTVLNQEGIKATLLPLFGNIPPVKGDGWDRILEPLISQLFGTPQDRAQLYLAGIFGAVHPEWDAGQVVDALLPLVQRSQKQLVLVFLGKSNLTFEAADVLRSRLLNRAVIVAIGERTDAEISKILQTLDLGLATSPRQVIQKSGSVAAMLEHGLPVLVTRDDWHLRGPGAPQEPTSSRLLFPEDFAALETLPARAAQPLQERTVRQVASQFLEAILLPST